MTLPIEAYLPKLNAAAIESPYVVIKAEPGAGKTTLFPKALLQTFPGKILVLEPRRLAAKLAAIWVAESLGETVGLSVGYAIRHDSAVNNDTRLIFQTEGLFIRALLGNPTLRGVDAVVIDEFHERHIYTDEALALLMQLQKTVRPDLKIVLMSATIDTRRLEKFLGGCRVFDLPGRTFPVETEYFGTIHDKPEDHFGAAVTKLWNDSRCPGDILVFCTGRLEIAQCMAEIQRILPNTKACSLTADMPPKLQKEIFAPLPRKIILATNVAETSLTMPAVTGVIDLGRAKLSSHAPWSGMPTLEVKKIAKDSCIQRAGRAGRTQAGVCFRLYSHDDFLSRSEFTEPEIKRNDLCQTLLDMIGILDRQGAGALQSALDLPWFDPPDSKAVESATRTLKLLGALNSEGLLTDEGRQMCQLAIHPRLARVIVGMQAQGRAVLGCLLGALIQEGGILRPGYRAFGISDCDIRYQVLLLKDLQVGRDWESEGLRRQLNPGAVNRVMMTFDLLVRQLGVVRDEPKNWEVPDQGFGPWLLLGFPDRVAKKRELPAARLKKKRDQRSLFNLCLGRGAILSDESTVQKHDLILALEATESLGRDAAKGTLIRLATSLTREDIAKDGPKELISETIEPRWNAKKEKVELTQLMNYGTLELGQTVLNSENHSHNGAACFLAHVKQNFSESFGDDAGLELYHLKLDILDRYNFETTSFPRFEGEMCDLFLEDICSGKTSYAELRRKTLASYVNEQLSWEQQQFLYGLLPNAIRMENGVERVVQYKRDQPPYIEGFVQDFFGVGSTPSIGEGRIPLTIQLLGPNKRPLQKTSDLQSYWQRTYPAELGELSRRYPKHHWPDDPLKAPPVLHKNRLKSDN